MILSLPVKTTLQHFWTNHVFQGIYQTAFRRVITENWWVSGWTGQNAGVTSSMRVNWQAWRSLYCELPVLGHSWVGKVKVRETWICITSHHEHTSKALRYGTHSHGISQLTCTPYIHLLIEWTIPAFSFPAEAGPHSHLPTLEGWKADWAWARLEGLGLVDVVFLT